MVLLLDASVAAVLFLVLSLVRWVVCSAVNPPSPSLACVFLRVWIGTFWPGHSCCFCLPVPGLPASSGQEAVLLCLLFPPLSSASCGSFPLSFSLVVGRMTGC